MTPHLADISVIAIRTPTLDALMQAVTSRLGADRDADADSAFADAIHVYRHILPESADE